jgi:hypothetical protein
MLTPLPASPGLDQYNRDIVLHASAKLLKEHQGENCMVLLRKTMQFSA